jgi:hypothetical protein
VGRLKHRVAVGEHRTRLSQSEPKLPEEALALAHPQIDLELAFQVGGEGLAIPEGPRESYIFGSLSYDGRDGTHLELREAARSARALALGETRESFFLEPTNPVLNGTRGIPEHSTDVRGGHPLGHEEEPVKPVIVPGLIGPSNLVLEGEDHILGVRDGEGTHGASKGLCIRNYL